MGSRGDAHRRQGHGEAAGIRPAAKLGWSAARSPGGDGAPVLLQPWEEVEEVQLSGAKLLVGSVGSGGRRRRQIRRQRRTDRWRAAWRWRPAAQAREAAEDEQGGDKVRAHGSASSFYRAGARLGRGAHARNRRRPCRVRHGHRQAWVQMG
jgi:hypothetical protein